MEGVAWATHKYVMHSFGWAWHRSHHQSRGRGVERNDLYAVLFGSASVGPMALGGWMEGTVYWVGAGMAFYGVLYFIMHDGLVHRRWPIRLDPRHAYLRRLIEAHRLHHAVQDKDGCVSFGFLYAPPVEQVRRTLREKRTAL